MKITWETIYVVFLFQSKNRRIVVFSYFIWHMTKMSYGCQKYIKKHLQCYPICLFVVIICGLFTTKPIFFRHPNIQRLIGGKEWRNICEGWRFEEIIYVIIFPRFFFTIISFEWVLWTFFMDKIGWDTLEVMFYICNIQAIIWLHWDIICHMMGFIHIMEGMVTYEHIKTKFIIFYEILRKFHYLRVM